MLICEDSSIGNMLRALTTDGQILDFALNAVGAGTDEFSGSTFAPGSQVLYVNMQSNGLTYAIWGPWSRGRCSPATCAGHAEAGAHLCGRPLSSRTVDVVARERGESR